MEQKKVIIVGASSGMGRELARIYAAKGALVAATGRRHELLYTLQKTLPNNIITSGFDVTGHDSISYIRSLIDQLGGLDIFVIAAGVGIVGESLDREADKIMINTNVNAFAEMSNWVFNYYLENGGKGQLANISSMASWRGNSWSPAYSASKAFQSVYFEGLHMKAKKIQSAISITDIVPGFVDTKASQGNKRFWIVPTEKAARQIYHAIESRQFRVFVSRRWRLVSWALKWAPDFVYHRMG